MIHVLVEHAVSGRLRKHFQVKLHCIVASVVPFARLHIPYHDLQLVNADLLENGREHDHRLAAGPERHSLGNVQDLRAFQQVNVGLGAQVPIPFRHRGGNIHDLLRGDGCRGFQFSDGEVRPKQHARICPQHHGSVALGALDFHLAGQRLVVDQVRILHGATAGLWGAGHECQALLVICPAEFAKQIERLELQMLGLGWRRRTWFKSVHGQVNIGLVPDILERLHPQGQRWTMLDGDRISIPDRATAKGSGLELGNGIGAEEPGVLDVELAEQIFAPIAINVRE